MVEYSLTKNHSGLLIDKESEWTAQQQRIRVDYSSTIEVLIDKKIAENCSTTNNQSGLIIEKESDWTTHRQRIRVDNSSTKNKSVLLIEKRFKVDYSS